MTSNRSLAAVVVLIAGLAGCAAEPEAEPVPTVVDTASAPIDAAPDPDPVGDLTQIETHVPAPERAYRLLLVNPGSSIIPVRADAGAGTVSVDTVAPGDSARIDLLVRADSVRLLVGRNGVDAWSAVRLSYPADTARRIDLTLP